MTPDSSENQKKDMTMAATRPELNEFVMDTNCFQRLYNALGDGVVNTDTHGVIVQANPAFCSAVGYAQDELIGKPLLDFTPEEDREDEARTIENFIASDDGPCEFEKTLIHREGRRLNIQATCWLHRGTRGEVLGIWGVLRDITHLRTAEKEALRNLEKYRFLAENAEDIIWALGQDGRYTYVSPSVERIRGFTPEEMVGKRMQDCMTADSYALVQEKLRMAEARSARGETVLNSRLELQVKCKDGSLLWSETVAKALMDKDHKWVGLVGSTRDITERKRIEGRLKTSEQSLLAMLNATENSVGLFKLDGTVLAMNLNMANFFGCSWEDALNLSPFGLIPENLRHMVKEAFRQTVETRKTVTEQAVWSGRLLTGTFYPVITGTEVSAIAVYIKDVTEARFAEEAQKKTQEQYRLIVETANEGILGLDANQRITYANKIVAKFFGCRVDEIIGQSVLDFIDPSDREDNLQRMERRGIGDRERYERRFVRNDGTVVWGLVSATPLMSEDGRLLGAFAMIADITEVKQAHERMVTILDGISSDICVSDFETNEILFMNAHMRERFKPFEEGSACHKVVRGLDARCSFCAKPSLVDKAGDPVGTLVTERYYEDQKRWYLNHDRAIKWLQGKLVHMHTGTDITELKNMAVELERAMIKAEAASLAKNEFLANMSHEIRTPLNGLLGMLQLLQLSSLGPTQADYLETALSSGRSLLQVLNDILDLSKVESGKLELEEMPFELGEVLDSVVSTFLYAVKARGIRMAWEIDTALPRHFLGDKGRLRQILFNLVGNAVKFTDTGSIMVRAYPLGSRPDKDKIRILFEVADTGIGIPEDKVNVIFDPFIQVDGSLTRKYQGTGLGLGIVHRLVQLMGGTISVDSSEGDGTRIYFTLLVKKIEAPPTEVSKPSEDIKSQGLSILVAEDERVNRMVIQRILEKLGHKPLCVENGEAAIKILKEQSFDIFLTDIQMPGMDGIETAHYVREQMHLDIPIVALTAHAMKGDKNRFIKAGMNGYIAKPFEIDRLQQNILLVMKEHFAGKESPES